jgi:hypothetical protein
MLANPTREAEVRPQSPARSGARAYHGKPSTTTAGRKRLPLPHSFTFNVLPPLHKARGGGFAQIRRICTLRLSGLFFNSHST